MHVIGSVEEIHELQLQLKQTKTGRDMSQETCQSLQEELGDLKEQLQMYESAAELGVLAAAGKGTTPKISESFAHLGVRNLDKGDWETPKNHWLVYTEVFKLWVGTRPGNSVPGATFKEFVESWPLSIASLKNCLYFHPRGHSRIYGSHLA